MIPRLYTSPSGRYRFIHWLGFCVAWYDGRIEHLTFLHWHIRP